MSDLWLADLTAEQYLAVDRAIAEAIAAYRAELRATIAAWRDPGDTPGRRWRAFVGVADTLLDRLAEQGYVLVNVEGLAAARGKREFGAYYPPRDDEWAEALLAYLKDDAHSA